MHISLAMSLHWGTCLLGDTGREHHRFPSKSPELVQNELRDLDFVLC